MVLSAGGEQYVYRTDETGEIVQPENPGNLPGGGEQSFPISQKAVTELQRRYDQLADDWRQQG